MISHSCFLFLCCRLQTNDCREGSGIPSSPLKPVELWSSPAAVQSLCFDSWLKLNYKHKSQRIFVVGNKWEDEREAMVTYSVMGFSSHKQEKTCVSTGFSTDKSNKCSVPGGSTSHPNLKSERYTCRLSCRLLFINLWSAMMTLVPAVTAIPLCPQWSETKSQYSHRWFPHHCPSEARGCWEIHLCAQQQPWPATICLCLPDSAMWVFIFVILSDPVNLRSSSEFHFWNDL